MKYHLLTSAIIIAVLSPWLLVGYAFIQMIK